MTGLVKSVVKCAVATSEPSAQLRALFGLTFTLWLPMVILGSVVAVAVRLLATTCPSSETS